MAAGGKVWLITGCSSGFGYVLAEEALKRGDRVVATARNRATLAALEAAFPQHAVAMALDVCDAGQIARVVAAAERIGDGIDILVNNAGVVALGAIEEHAPASYRRVFETNFFGALAVMQAVLPGMRQRRRGHIVNMSALGGLAANAGLGYYCATKHALEAVSEALAEEVASLGIKVLLVEPGQFRTKALGNKIDAPHIADYEATLAPLRGRFESLEGKQPGDPRLAAHAIFAALEASPPTLRLPLGRDALTRIRAKLARVNADMDRWESVALATDYKDGA